MRQTIGGVIELGDVAPLPASQDLGLLAVDLLALLLVAWCVSRWSADDER